jgi:hypothetical protein
MSKNSQFQSQQNRCFQPLSYFDSIAETTFTYWIRESSTGITGWREAVAVRRTRQLLPLLNAILWARTPGSFSRERVIDRVWGFGAGWVDKLIGSRENCRLPRFLVPKDQSPWWEEGEKDGELCKSHSLCLRIREAYIFLLFLRGTIDGEWVSGRRRGKG